MLRNRALFQSALFLMLAFASVDLRAADLSATWKGTFQYADNRGDPVNFTVTIQDNGDGSFTGTMFEPNTGIGPANEKEIQASISGKYDGVNGAIIFTKTYLFEKAKGHSVDYRGKLDKNRKTISGKWTVGPAVGSFQMVKKD